jgi:hypothetical protein
VANLTVEVWGRRKLRKRRGAEMRSVSSRLAPVLAAFLLVFTASSASAGQWEDSIARVKEMQRSIDNKARALGAGPAGSAYNGLDFEKHRCSILGRMLGRTGVVAHLEVEYPWQTENNGDTLRLMSASLDSWVAVATELKDFDRPRRIVLWNLECAGKLGIAASEAIAEANSQAFYDVVDDGQALRVLGDVNEGFAQRLRDALDANPRAKIISLGSMGGYVTEAIQAGLEIRRRGLDTQLHAACYSACPLVYLGGVNRTMWIGLTDLGFHKAFGPDGAVPQDSALYKLISEYVSTMGADAATVLRLMWSAEPDQMTIATTDTICDARIATWIQRLCP